MRHFAFLLLLAVPSPLAGQASGTARAEQVRVEGGEWLSPFAQPGERPLQVRPFRIDVQPVSRAQFAAFVEAYPRWRRDRVAGVFADRNYLRDWASPADPGPGAAAKPVTNVSWFAARSYCRARGARLPTTAEWELLARADENRRDASRDRSFLTRTLALATAPRAERLRMRAGFRNAFGVWGIHGGVQEWVLDFNSTFAGSDSRKTSDDDDVLTCAAGATATGSNGDYAAFMRFAFRAASEGSTSSNGMGFRCASDLP